MNDKSQLFDDVIKSLSELIKKLHISLHVHTKKNNSFRNYF